MKLLQHLQASASIYTFPFMFLPLKKSPFIFLKVRVCIILKSKQIFIKTQLMKR